MWYELVVHCDKAERTWQGVGYWRVPSELDDIQLILDQMAEAMRAGIMEYTLSDIHQFQFTMSTVLLKGQNQMKAARCEARRQSSGGNRLEWCVLAKEVGNGR